MDCPLRAPTDPCPHHIYNLGTSMISKALSGIRNTAISTATFLEAWKHAADNVLLKKTLADPTELAY